MWAAGAAWLVSTPEAGRRHPYACVLFFGALNVDLLTDMMLSHVADTDVKPLRPLLVLPVAAAAVALGIVPPAIVQGLGELLRFSNIGTKGEAAVASAASVAEALPVPLACAAIAYVAVRLVRLVIEVRDALGIYVFSIRKRTAD